MFIKHFLEKLKESKKIEEEKRVEEEKKIKETFDKLGNEDSFRELIYEDIIKHGAEYVKAKLGWDNTFIIKYFPPEELTITDYVNGLFGMHSRKICDDDWNAQVFERIPEIIYTDVQFLSLLKSRLEYIKSGSYENYIKFKKSLCLHAPDSVRLFIELEC